MNIIFATKEEAEKLGEKYIVLELDTFRLTDQSDPVTSWCVIDTSAVSLGDLSRISQFVDLHKNLIKNYRLRNWKYCKDALEHLVGKWRGEIDSFYNVLEQRIEQYSQSDLAPEWDGIIDKR